MAELQQNRALLALLSCDYLWTDRYSYY